MEIRLEEARPIKMYTVENLINEIAAKRIRKIVVLTGAGISTPSGIPDFRSAGTGLYDNLDQFDVPYPEAIFERSYFNKNPRPFFNLTKNLLPDLEKNKPNKIHYFLRLLQEKKLLHRLYTQNIDGLESLSGIEANKLIEAHGSFRSAKCTSCLCSYSGLYVKNQILNDKIPICKIGRCSGVVKPDIVFFGESLPEPFYKMHENDLASAELVLVMGTSLEVEPFSNIVKLCRNNVPRLLMNRNSVGPFQAKINNRKKDLQILGDLISCVEFFVEKLGWTMDLENLITREVNLLTKCSKESIEKFYFSNRTILERSHSAIDLKKFKSINSANTVKTESSKDEIKNINSSFSNNKNLLSSLSNLSILSSSSSSNVNADKSKSQINLSMQKFDSNPFKKLENIRKYKSVWKIQGDSDSESDNKKSNNKYKKVNKYTKQVKNTDSDSSSDSDESTRQPSKNTTKSKFYRSNNSSQFSNYSFNSSVGSGSTSSFLLNSNLTMNKLLLPNQIQSRLLLSKRTTEPKEPDYQIYYRNSLFKANSKSATIKKDLINAQI